MITPSRVLVSRKRISSLLSLVMALAVLSTLGGCRSDEEKVEVFMERGRAYMEEGKADEAIIEFKNALQVDPNLGDAHDQLSLAFISVQKPREAYWEMSETVRLDPTNIEARVRYGTLSAAIGDHDLAIEQANAVLELDPDVPQAYVIRAQSRESKGDLAGAEEDYKSSIRGDIVGPAYQFLATGFLERQGRYDEAEGLAVELMNLEESYLAASTLARLIARNRDRDEETVAMLKKAVELSLVAPVDRAPVTDGRWGPTSLLPNSPRDEATVSAYMMLSAFYYDRGQFDDSIATLEDGVDKIEKKTELIYQMARLHRMEGNVEEADALIFRATEESPDDATPQLVLSAYLGQQGDLDGALKAAQAAIAIDPESRPAQLRTAELLVDVGYRDKDKDLIQEGRAVVDSILELEPSSPEGHFVRAKIELAEGDSESAIQSLETALQTRPDWAQARFVLGSTLAVDGSTQRARVELARAVEIDPTLIDARKLLTRIHAQLGEHEFAVEQGRAYLEKRPDDIQTRIIVGQSLIRIGRAQDAYREILTIPEEDRDASAYFALGRIDLGLGRRELGVERILKAEALAPGNPKVLQTLLALDIESKTLEKSAERIAKALAENPDDSQLNALEGEVKNIGGDDAGARASFRRAIELDPRNMAAQLALADLYRRGNDIDGTIGVLEGATSAIPESADLHHQLGMIYEQVGRRQDAIRSYENAIAVDSQMPQAMNNLAYMLAETDGDLDRALELAQAAKEQLPDDPSASDTLGWVLYKRGVPSAAIGYLKEAVDGFPPGALEANGIVLNHLAAAYEKNKEVEKAVATSRQSVDFHGRMIEAAKAQGIEMSEADWFRDAQDRITRLEQANS